MKVRFSSVDNYVDTIPAIPFPYDQVCDVTEEQLASVLDIFLAHPSSLSSPFIDFNREDNCFEICCYNNYVE